MAVTAGPLIPATALPLAVAALYTVPVLTSAQIRKLTVANPTTEAINFNLYLLEAGQTSTAATILVSAKTVASGATQEVFVAEGHVLSAGGSIAGDASAAGLVIQASGVLVQ
jgi:hypothetical protein